MRAYVPLAISISPVRSRIGHLANFLGYRSAGIFQRLLGYLQNSGDMFVDERKGVSRLALFMQPALPRDF